MLGTDRHHRTVAVYLCPSVRGNGQGQRRRVVGRTLHLLHIPVCLKERQVASPHISPETFRLQIVPQRESIVIAAAVYYGISLLLSGSQIVLPEIACHIPAGTVVIVPSLTGHLYRHKQAEQRHKSSCGNGLFLDQTVDIMDKSRHAHAYPDGKGIERTGVCIVALARLQRSLIQIKHYGKPCHEKQEEDHPETLQPPRAASQLPEYAYETQQKRQTVEHVMSLVVSQLSRQLRLVGTDQPVVYEVKPGYPVAFVGTAVALQVVLPAGKVPHEITPVHIVHLIGQEETNVFHKRGHLHSLRTGRCLHRLVGLVHAAHPRLILRSVSLVVHSRKEHVGLVLGRIIFRLQIPVLVFGRLLRRTVIALGHNPVIIISLLSLLVFIGGSILLPVKQRTVSILLPAQIGCQQKHIVGSIFIERRISCGTYHDDRIRRIAYEHHHDAQHGGVEKSGRNVFRQRQRFGKQQESRNRRHHYTYDKARCAFAVERNAEHDKRDEKRQLGTEIARLLPCSIDVCLIHAPHYHKRKQYGIYDES